MVPKHRRSDVEAALAPARAPLSAAEFWSDELGRRRADPLARRRPAHARALGSPAADRTSLTGSPAAEEADAGWRLGPGVPSFDAFGPPPALHPDHPSAPVPRVRVPVDYSDPVEYTGPLPRLNGYDRHAPGRPPGNPARMAQAGRQEALRDAAAAQAYAPRPDFSPPWAQAPSQGYTAQAYAAQGVTAQGYAWQAYGAAAQAYAEPADYYEPRAYATPQAYAEPVTYAPAESYPAEQDYAAPDPHSYTGPQRQARPRHSPGEPRGYQAARGRLHAVPSGPGLDYQSGPERDGRPGRARNDLSPGGEAAARDYAAGLREAAERDAEAIRAQAAQQAAALTREATQQAAKIREAAEKEAAQMRAALAAMSGEIGRVAAYVSENLTVPAIPASRPAEAPATRPTRPASLPAAPAARPERPAPQPRRPAAVPDEPTKNLAKRPRQYNAMLISRFVVAAGMIAAATAGTAELAAHGPAFFVFRSGGTGVTPSNLPTDQQFLNNEHPKPAEPKVVKPTPKTAKPAAKAKNANHRAESKKPHRPAHAL